MIMNIKSIQQHCELRYNNFHKDLNFVHLYEFNTSNTRFSHTGYSDLSKMNRNQIK